MSSPWGKITVPEPMNLEDIMSEELAKEDKKYTVEDENFEKIDFDISPELLEEEKLIKSDEQIARLLQQQFDKEHDKNLKRSEEKYNGSSKVSISFSNYQRAPLNDDFDSEEEELEDIRDRKDWDRFDTSLREFHTIPTCCYKMKNGNIITNHYVTIGSRKNYWKMMCFPPEFETGDDAGFDMNISNKVFNSYQELKCRKLRKKYRRYDKRESSKIAKYHADSTAVLLYKMMNADYFTQVNGVIHFGKKSVILRGDLNPNSNYKCAIKVFKRNLSGFKETEEYMKNDLKLECHWAEREMHNLKRLMNAGIPCPEVIHQEDNILVMLFIGIDGKAARTLKHVNFYGLYGFKAYEQVVHSMKSLYSKCNLIHTDLSENSILWHHKICHIIDVCQAVEPSDENAFHFLYRDCKNITIFFTKLDVPGIATAEELFEDITGYSYKDKEPLVELQESKKIELAYT